MRLRGREREFTKETRGKEISKEVRRDEREKWKKGEGDDCKQEESIEKREISWMKLTENEI